MDTAVAGVHDAEIAVAAIGPGVEASSRGATNAGAQSQRRRSDGGARRYEGDRVRGLSRRRSSAPNEGGGHTEFPAGPDDHHAHVHQTSSGVSGGSDY